MNESNQERRGLRFPFEATAEIQVGASSSAWVPGRVTELSLRGCLMETSGSFQEQQRLSVKIVHSGEYFESSAAVLYVKPSGIGLVFSEMKLHYRAVLQKWILEALDKVAEPKT